MKKGRRKRRDRRRRSKQIYYTTQQITMHAINQKKTLKSPDTIHLLYLWLFTYYNAPQRRLAALMKL